ncbi:hypothetical protein [Aquimarina sp. AU474]|uniref:hypothetical protein n=1 Tax=Aquimarina sp. AU474 TaxID=2108529 RepID=UPI000D69EE9F|nr:hypothetical protein [Aquimarina sp. AU474]
MKIIRFIKRGIRSILTFGFNIEWKSKIIDLLIVIIGITLAFRLNSWSESKKQDSLLKNYVTSFSLENEANIESLINTLNYSELQLSKIDTLQEIMRNEAYNDMRLRKLSPSLLNTVNYKSSTITLENIKESGDFELIKNYKLRKKIITVYESLSELKEKEKVLNDYVKTITRPYFFEKIRYRDFYPVDDEGMVKDHRYENMIIGYGIILTRQIQTYHTTRAELEDLKEELALSLNN